MKSPCIRNIKRFEKKGCPEIAWSEIRQEGCPCWKTIPIPDPDNPLKKISKSMCIDLWFFQLKLEELALLEGNQIATESFRNGMITTNNKGEKIPKPVTMQILMPGQEQFKLEE